MQLLTQWVWLGWSPSFRVAKLSGVWVLLA